ASPTAPDRNRSGRWVPAAVRSTAAMCAGRRGSGSGSGPGRAPPARRPANARASNRRRGPDTGQRSACAVECGFPSRQFIPSLRPDGSASYRRNTMFDNLTQRLSRVVKTIRGEARLTEENIADAMREVRMALLEADVALPVVKDFIANVREKALGEEVIGSLTPGQALVGVVHRELTALMGGDTVTLNLNVAPPAVVLMAGLQGAGKTTTVGKLAKLLKEE